MPGGWRASEYGDGGRLEAAIVVAFMTTRRTIPALAVALALALVATACGSKDGSGSASSSPTAASGEGQAATIKRNEANSKVELTIGSKNFTEQKVLGEIYAQALSAAGYNVRTALNLGDEHAALEALKTNKISGYPEYTGTALLSFLNVPAAKLPGDEAQAYEEVKAGMARQGIDALAPTPFTSSNEVGLLKKKAGDLGVTKISDLASKAGGLTLYGSPECRMRRDCLLGLEQVYGLRFKRFVPVAPDQRHQVLIDGKADVSIVFSTDPQIKRNNELVLEDDKGMLPPYNSTFLVKRSVADKAGPDLATTIDAVNKDLTTDVMQELNARVDIDQDTPEQAAQAYLKQFELIPS
jgi:osmoprotectant transport system substrate-binding protein